MLVSLVNSILESVSLFAPLVITVLTAGLGLWGAHILLIRKSADQGSERMFPRQLAMLGLTLTSIIAVVFALPVDESSRNQIIGLVGLLVSGVFAFSSTNIFANLAAGILLRVTKPFHIGDFIYVRDYFGRVAERGLFDTEIQSEAGELIAIPNTYLISSPVSTVRGSAAIVSASLSLGYDVHHSRIERLLIESAKKCGLEDGFVHITELGNYAITYRVSGVLPEVKGLITARSNLYRAVLDVLHSHGVEIVSPSFSNRRQLGEDHKTIPISAAVSRSDNPASAEEILFDKAEQAARVDEEKRNLAENIQRLEQTLKGASAEEKAQAKQEIAAARERIKMLDQGIHDLDEKDAAAAAATARQ